MYDFRAINQCPNSRRLIRSIVPAMSADTTPIAVSDEFVATRQHTLSRERLAALALYLEQMWAQLGHELTGKDSQVVSSGGISDSGS